MNDSPMQQDQVLETPGPLPESAVVEKSPEELLQEVLAAPEPDGSQIVNLQKGVVCRLRAGKGRDLLAAQRMAGTDPNKVMYGLIAVLGTFNGQQKVLEDILDMPLDDVMTLMGKLNGVTGGDFLPSTPDPSSTLRP